jgi:hypothetical protein
VQVAEDQLPVLELVVQHGGAEHGAIVRAARRVEVVVKGVSPGVAEMERGRSLVCGGRWRGEEEEEEKEEEGKEAAAARGGHDDRAICECEPICKFTH